MMFFTALISATGGSDRPDVPAPKLTAGGVTNPLVTTDATRRARLQALLEGLPEGWKTDPWWSFEVRRDDAPALGLVVARVERDGEVSAFWQLEGTTLADVAEGAEWLRERLAELRAAGVDVDGGAP